MIRGERRARTIMGGWLCSKIRSARWDAAAEDYERAASLRSNAAERDYLTRRGQEMLTG
jgi:predicted RNA polymerase sigma factor